MKRVLIIGTLLIITKWSASQTGQNIVEDRVEFVAQEYEGEELDLTTLTEYFEALLDEPINLNTAGLPDLEQTYLLRTDQIKNILLYRERYGPFRHIHELKAVPTLDALSIQRILPFVEVGPSEVVKRSPLSRLKYSRHFIMLRFQRVLEEQDGYSSGDYLGSPDRQYLRYRLTAGKSWSIGITGEKDHGEPFGGESNRLGFDFVSGHIGYSGRGRIEKVVLGDFQAQFGQGLTIWTGFGFRKSPLQVLNVQRFARGFVPYTSTDENNFLRGAAITGRVSKRIKAHLFYSRKQVDANLEESDTLNENNNGFTSIQTTGFHRTENEIADKDAIREEVLGSGLELRLDKWTIGINHVFSRLDGSFNRNLGFYNQFELDSNFNAVTGLHYQGLLGRLILFGEASRSLHGAWAHIHGGQLPVHEQLNLLLVFRDYAFDFQNLYSNSFGEKSKTANERSIYFGAQILPTPGLELQLFADLYRHPWLAYRVDAPSSGEEYSIMAKYSISRSFEVTAIFRHESNAVNDGIGESRMNAVTQKALSQGRFQVDYKISEKWSFRNRISYRRFRIDDIKEGFGIYQDLRFAPNPKLNFRARYALFRTDSYDTRIYTYEHDMLYQFTVPAYYGQGIKTYLLMNWKPFDNVSVQARIARLIRNDVDEIGSGNELIEDNHRTEFKAHLICKF